MVSSKSTKKSASDNPSEAARTWSRLLFSAEGFLAGLLVVSLHWNLTRSVRPLASEGLDRYASKRHAESQPRSQLLLLSQPAQQSNAAFGQAHHR
jgi:hypothetical protein